MAPFTDPFTGPHSGPLTKRRYFDWAATAMPDPAGDSASLPAPFGNPSSIHAEGKAARRALEEARSRCAGALGVKAEELFFTSGGTESNAIVLFSLLCKPRGSAALLYSAAEHPSIRENAAALEQTGVPCAAIGVEADGRVSEAALERALAKKPAARMAAIMAVNNETGAINDMRALSALLRSRQDKGFPPVHLHCDAVQAAGKIPLDLYGWGIDSASVSAHKLGGSRDIGLLWLKSPIIPLLRGGGQEKNIRPGTENTQGAADLARALEKYAAALPSLHREAAERMKALIVALRNTASFIPIPADRKDDDSRFSPWILQGAFRNSSGKIIPGEVIVRALDERGFALSTGSACSSAQREKRPVLDAMGLDRETSLGGVRISQGWPTTMEDIEALAEAVGVLCGTL
ncbi:MAG: cysteine desulfurase [Spirochaetaceae bacterium]|jgi:cysteine desulfurase|nr:cysteine desulfurase [Spirochaetaceae bacterium]